MRIAHIGLSAFVLLLSTLSSAAQDEAAGVLLKADQLMRRHQPQEAVELYKKANEQSGGKCPECMAGMAAAFNEMGAFKPAVEWSQKLIDLNASMEMSLRGYKELGLAHMKKPGEDAKSLAAAEDAFRKVLELSQGRYNDGRYVLGIILLRQKRDQEGLAALKEYIEREPTGANAASAKQMIERPQCGREQCAPEFSLVTADGDYLTQENLNGKVTLLHFFACSDIWQDQMWPDMKRLAMWTKKTDSPVQVIGIASERDEERVRAFVRQRGITWPVALDSRFKAGSTFGVSGFPYQILINHEGTILYRRLNWSDDQADILSREISIAVDALKRSLKSEKGDKPKK
jgi:tetratricopeptide (TPR) repeat protein